eukprot:scaffold3673_cov393-Prasinococcus_capsulatus_cf.AAC.7
MSPEETSVASSRPVKARGVRPCHTRSAAGAACPGGHPASRRASQATAAPLPPPKAGSSSLRGAAPMRRQRPDAPAPLYYIARRAEAVRPSPPRAGAPSRPPAPLPRWPPRSNRIQSRLISLPEHDGAAAAAAAAASHRRYAARGTRRGVA